MRAEPEGDLRARGLVRLSNQTHLGGGSERQLRGVTPGDGVVGLRAPPALLLRLRPCPSCGCRVARSRLQEHFLDPECLLAEVSLQFRELGMDLALERHRPLVLAALGIDPDAELANVRADPRASGKMAWAPCCVVYPEAGTRRLRARRRAEPRYPGSPTLGYGWWVERRLLDCARLLDGLGGGALSRRARQLAARRAYLDPDWADALRAARALGGADAARRLVRAAAPDHVRVGGSWQLGDPVSGEDVGG